jgi:hypothetical protein
MIRRILLLGAVVSVLVFTASAVFAQLLPTGVLDDFEGYAVGKFPAEGTTASGPLNLGTDWRWQSVRTSSDTGGIYRYAAVEAAGTVPGAQGQCIVMHDQDDTGTSTLNQQFRTDFLPSPWPTTGTYVVLVDFMAAQTDANFKIGITDGPGWTNASDLIANLGFAGTKPIISGTGQTAPTCPGGLVYETTQSKQTWLQVPDVSYSANVWYSLKFVIDIDAKMASIYWKPRDDAGPFTALVESISWIQNQSTYTTASSFGGVQIATSNVAGDYADSGGSKDTGAYYYLDNVYCSPEPASILALAAMLGVIPALRRRRS